MDNTRLVLIIIFGAALLLELLMVLFHIANIDFFKWAYDVQSFIGFDAWISIHKDFIYLFTFIVNILIFVGLILDIDKFRKEAFMFLVIISLVYIFVEIYFLSGLLYLIFAILLRFLLPETFKSNK